MGMLRSVRDHLTLQHDDYLGVGYEEQIALRDKSEKIKHLRFLYFQYRPGMWAWEIFQCFHKVVLTGLLMFVLDGTALQIVIGIFVTFVIFGMFAYFQPFLDPKETILEVLALFAVFICLLLGLMFRTAVMMVIHDVSGAFEDAKAAK